MGATPQVIFDQTPFEGGILDASDPTAVANLQTTNYVAEENSERRSRYLSGYAQYRVNMESGEPIPAERRVAPVPEMAQAVSAADKQGLVHAFESNVPVCEALPDVFYHGITQAEVVASKPAGVFELGGKTGNAGWFQVGPNDTMPRDFEKTLPGPDGKLIKVRKVCTPWGCSYEQVG